jgi:putative pyruvate formate lyase activating enzyme
MRMRHLAPMQANELYKACMLCPRRCSVDRTNGRTGFCGESAEPRIASIQAHLGEEPPISAQNGSGTVFFSGCPLRCRYCQNHQISHKGMGRVHGVEEVVDRISFLYEAKGIHNVNFVTPDHFLPHTVLIVRLLRERQIHIPTVYNFSGYQHVEALRIIRPWADIYLPDFKYSDSALARNLSRCPDYPEVALDALAEMVKQKGFLDSFPSIEDQPPEGGSFHPAGRGVLVRHLVLPGHVRNSLNVLTTLYIEFGKRLPLSIMAQYTPVQSFPKEPALNRSVAPEEFHEVLDHALGLGFLHILAQYPSERTSGPPPFLPDFHSSHPFAGNPRG